MTCTPTASPTPDFSCNAGAVLNNHAPLLSATAVLKYAKTRPDKASLASTAAGAQAAVALANKMARVAWAVLARGEAYRAPALAVAV